MMKLIIKICLVVQLLGAPFVLFAGLTQEDNLVIERCIANVEGKKDPRIAAGCVDELNKTDFALLNKVRNKDQSYAAVLLSYNNAIVDLKNIVDKYNGLDAGRALDRVLEANVCPLCEIGLGRGTERLLSWVKEFAPGRFLEIRNAVRSWDSLGAERIAFLSKSYNPKFWESMMILRRYETLSDHARIEVDKLMSRENIGDEKNCDEMAKRIKLLREDLALPEDESYLIKLDMIEEASCQEKDKRTEDATVKDKPDSPNASLGIDAGLKNRSVMEQFGLLGKTFDKSSQEEKNLPDTRVKSGGRKRISLMSREEPIGEQVKKLSEKMIDFKNGRLTGYLAEEIKGTKAGDEIIAFYQDPAYAKIKANKVAMEIDGEDMAGFVGKLTHKKVIKINPEVVGTFAANRGLTVKDLLESEKDMRALAAYIAPVFVHEATHQRQEAWAQANGINYMTFKGERIAPYNAELETEAFSMHAAFGAEKARQKGPAYFSTIPEYIGRDAEKFIEEGVGGIRSATQRRYFYLDTLEGAAAKEFRLAQVFYGTAQSLEKDGCLVATDAGGGGVAAQQGVLGQMGDARFKWYAMSMKKSQDDEKKLTIWRDELTGSVFPTGDISSNVPPLR